MVKDRSSGHAQGRASVLERGQSLGRVRVGGGLVIGIGHVQPLFAAAPLSGGGSVAASSHATVARLSVNMSLDGATRPLLRQLQQRATDVKHHLSFSRNSVLCADGELVGVVHVPLASRRLAVLLQEVQEIAAGAHRQVAGVAPRHSGRVSGGGDVRPEVAGDRSSRHGLEIERSPRGHDAGRRPDVV